MSEPVNITTETTERASTRDGGPGIEVRSLAFKYPDGTPALHDISFAIPAGQCVGLIGPNGAGKSTLLWHLNGLLPESWPAGAKAADRAGSHGAADHRDESNLTPGSAVSIMGLAVDPGNLPEIRRRVGLMFQDPNDQLFCPTVQEDVAFGPEQLNLPMAEIKQRVSEALARVGLTGFERRSPHHLSVGEKRRVCLAGVLACDPQVLVLDEPSSALDPRGRRELKELLRTIHITQLIATHDLELVVELCPRVIVMDKGTIVADGPTLDILANETFMLEHGLEKPHILMHQHPHGA